MNEIGARFGVEESPPRLRVTDTVGGQQYEVRTGTLPDPTPETRIDTGAVTNAPVNTLE